MKKLSALCLALLLTACGGSSGGGDAPFVPGPTPAPPPAVVNDSFFTQVLNLIGFTNDSDDAGTIDSVVLTAPEDTEPVPVI